MTGSRKWFIYTTDFGDDFAIQLDESNTEFLNGGGQDFGVGSAIAYSIPRNLTPRVCVFSSADNTIRRNTIALTPTIFNGILPGSTFLDPVSAQTLYLTLKKAERVRVPKPQDTGITDGDVD